MPSRSTTASPERSWEIGDWTQRADGRWAFTATPVQGGPMFDAWVGPVGKRVTFPAAARNPISYWPPQGHPPSQ